mgnify:CR=1 FL=1
MQRPLLEKLANAEVARHGSFVTPVVALGTLLLGGIQVFNEVMKVNLRTGYVARLWGLAALMNLADVCVHFPEEPEPFGRVVAEAMACGRPVVAAACGGIPEIVTHGRDGILVPPGDLGALADAVGRVLSEPELASRLGSEARNTVLARFSAHAHVRAMTAVYAEILGLDLRHDAPGRARGSTGTVAGPAPPSGA